MKKANKVNPTPSSAKFVKQSDTKSGMSWTKKDYDPKRSKEC